MGMSDNLGRDVLLIVTTIVFISFVLGSDSGQENNDEENENQEGNGNQGESENEDILSSLLNRM